MHGGGAVTLRRAAALDALAGLVFTGLLLWGHRNLRGNRA